MATHFKGPVVSDNGFTGDITGNITGNVTGNISGAVAATTLTASTSFAVGASGASIKAIKSGTVAVDPGTLAAGDELDIAVTITGAAAGDIVQVMPTDTAMEAGLAIVGVWVSATNTVKIRVSNMNAAAALTGGSQNWTYLWTDLT